jgi:hypothetical protein
VATKFHDRKRWPSDSPPTRTTRPPRGATSVGVVPGSRTIIRHSSYLHAVDLDRMVERIERAFARIARRETDAGSAEAGENR